MEQIQSNTKQDQASASAPESRLRAKPQTKVVTRRVVPAIDIFENEDEFMLVADVPGLGESDLDLTFEKGVLNFSGAAEIAGRHVEYRRAIAVPESIDAQAINASLERGVLSVHLPKRAELKPRRIAINTQ